MFHGVTGAQRDNQHRGSRQEKLAPPAPEKWNRRRARRLWRNQERDLFGFVMLVHTQLGAISEFAATATDDFCLAQRRPARGTLISAGRREAGPRAGVDLARDAWNFSAELFARRSRRICSVGAARQNRPARPTLHFHLRG